MRERVLLNIVEEMALASGVPSPPVYILDNEEDTLYILTNLDAPNNRLVKVNAAIRNHAIEVCGAELRAAMTAMKKVVD